MKITGRPVRTTILFGFLAALALFPAVTVLRVLLSIAWSEALCLMVWLAVALYGVMLARWARIGLAGVLFPALVLLLFALSGVSILSFFLLAMGILSWIRSGVCFPKSPLRSLAIEALISFGGGIVVLLFHPWSTITWALGIWMFFLVQSAYFVLSGQVGIGEGGQVVEDPFEEARIRAERILTDPL